MSFAYKASECPTPVCPATFINPAAATPVVSKALVAGDVSQVLAKFNENAARLDALGRAGGGCYAVTSGLALSAGSGLSLNVAAGQAVIDSVVTVDPGTSVALMDAIDRCYLWLTRLGALTPVNNDPTPPAAECVFLGSATTAGGVITAVDMSGVMKLCGGTLRRDTADLTTPTDTPPDGLLFFSCGPYESWVWCGDRYLATSQQAALSEDTVASGATLTIPAGKQLVLVTLDVQGTLDCRGTLRVIGDQ
jgi:hypothetical protein